MCKKTALIIPVAILVFCGIAGAISKYNAQIVLHGNAQYDPDKKEIRLKLGDYLTIPDNDYFHLGIDDFTIDCWVELEIMIEDSPIIIGQGQSGVDHNFWELYLNKNGIGFVSAVDGKNEIFLFCRYNIKTSKEYHIVFKRQGSHLSCFVDDKLIGEDIKHCKIADGSETDIYIGKSSFNDSGYLCGRINKLRITRNSMPVYDDKLNLPTE